MTNREAARANFHFFTFSKRDVRQEPRTREYRGTYQIKGEFVTSVVNWRYKSRNFVLFVHGVEYHMVSQMSNRSSIIDDEGVSGLQKSYSIELWTFIEMFLDCFPDSCCHLLTQVAEEIVFYFSSPFLSFSSVLYLTKNIVESPASGYSDAHWVTDNCPAGLAVSLERKPVQLWRSGQVYTYGSQQFSSTSILLLNLPFPGETNRKAALFNVRSRFEPNQRIIGGLKIER